MVHAYFYPMHGPAKRIMIVVRRDGSVQSDDIPRLDTHWTLEGTVYMYTSTTRVEDRDGRTFWEFFNIYANTSHNPTSQHNESIAPLGEYGLPPLAAEFIVVRVMSDLSTIITMPSNSVPNVEAAVFS